ncbi:hypothetical protein ACIQJ4_25440 [Streptomyces filamentosus]|uniref:hypothetical protein n=1 Tax=Streptomyces filamentosus TaxID=67294 RepID=UPI0038295026
MNRRTVLLALAVTALSAAGCTTAPTTGLQTAPRPTAPDHSGQSLWHVIDKNGKTVAQLPDDDPLVTTVRKTVVLHSGIVDNRDHRTVATSAAGEFAFYNKGFAASLDSQHYKTKLERLFTDNRLATRQTSLAWYKSTFPEDRTTAKVDMETTIEFTAGDAAYLKAKQLALHTPYTQRRTISLAKTGDRWLIVAIEKNPLTRQAKTLPGGGDGR